MIVSNIAEIRQKVRALTADLDKFENTLQKGVAGLYGFLGLARRLNLPEPIDAGIMKLQQMIATVNMLRTSLIMLEMASGPWGWGLALIGIAGTALTVAETSVELGRPFG